MGLRETILECQDSESKVVYVPEWGQKVTVRSISAAERDRYEVGIDKLREKGKVRASLVALACYDAEGNRIFTDADADALSKKNASAVDRLWDIARTLAGMTERDVEELEGN